MGKKKQLRHDLKRAKKINKAAVIETLMSLRQLRQWGLPNGKQDHDDTFEERLVELFDLDAAMERTEMQIDRVHDKLQGRLTDEELEETNG